MSRTERIARLPERAAFAYSVVALLQLRMFWGVWNKDLVPSDEASYFGDAVNLLNGGDLRFAWSPLYATFIAPFEAVFGDATVTMPVQRLVVAMIAALLVLAILRRLLPPWAALIGACWWAIVPSIYDTLKTITLFGALPYLVMILLLCVGAELSWRRRGAVVAVLLVSGITLRNELFLPLLLLLGLFAIDLWRDRRAGRTIEWRQIAISGAAALAIGGVAFVAASEKAAEGPNKFDAIEAKARLNFCQVYQDNYIQRTPGYTRPKALCDQLMVELFDQPMPTYTDAWRANPTQMAKFTIQNGKQLPQAMEYALFGASWGGIEPDIVPTDTDQGYALTLLVFLLLLYAMGIRRLVLDRAHWWPWIKRMPWGWAGLALTASSVFAICLLTQGFKSTYMFGLTFGLITFALLCASALVRHHRWDDRASVAAAILPFALLILLQPHFRDGPTPVKDDVERVKAVYENDVDPAAAGSAQMLTNANAFSVCYYGDLPVDGGCVRPPADDVNLLAPDTRAGFEAGLEAAGVGVLYLIPPGPFFPIGAGVEQFIADPEGWSLVDSGENPAGPWRIFVRDEALRDEALAGDSG